MHLRGPSNQAGPKIDQTTNAPLLAIPTKHRLPGRCRTWFISFSSCGRKFLLEWLQVLPNAVYPEDVTHSCALEVGNEAAAATSQFNDTWGFFLWQSAGQELFQFLPPEIAHASPLTDMEVQKTTSESTLQAVSFSSSLSLKATIRFMNSCGDTSSFALTLRILPCRLPGTPAYI